MRADLPTRRPGLATLGLTAVTAAWGSTFYMVKDVTTRVPVADFLALRFWLAGIALWLLAPGSIGRLSPIARRRAIVLGVVYGTAQLLQTWGLAHTSASISGFVTGMYVVITPLLAAVLLRQRIRPVVLLAVALAVAGLAVMSLHGVALGPGEGLTLASAALYALHIVGLGAWSAGRDAHGLAVVQMLSIGVLCSLVALPDGVTLPATGADLAVLGYMALVSGALGMLMQTWAQAQLAPTRAAIVMTTEPVWAGGFAVTLGGEPLGLRLLTGGALVLAAMALTELPVGPADIEPQKPT